MNDERISAFPFFLSLILVSTNFSLISRIKNGKIPKNHINSFHRNYFLCQSVVERSRVRPFLPSFSIVNCSLIQDGHHFPFHPSPSSQ